MSHSAAHAVSHSAAHAAAQSVSPEASFLEDLIRQAAAARSSTASATTDSENEVTMRERFLELLTLSLANLFGKTPVASSLFDRNTMRLVSAGLDDNEAGRLSTRADDWIRLEGLVRVQEGQKSYTLNRPSLAVLCTPTSQGLLGEVMEGLAAVYANPGPTPEIRKATRALGAYFMTRVARS